MFKQFLSLEWKSFIRSASFGKSLGLRILLIFLALYFAAVFLAIGIAIYPGIEKFYPGEDPLETVNNFVLVWLLMELAYRFFLQTLPVMDIKPLLILPIKKRRVVNYVLSKSLFSFYNILPLFLIVPFGIFCIINNDYPTLNILAWMLAVFALSLCVNFGNFIIKKRFTDNLKALLPLITAMVILVVLEKLGIFSITQWFGNLLNYLVRYPYLVLVPLMLLILLYKWNQLNLQSKFYLDAGLKGRTQTADTKSFDWTKKFGSIAPFLQQDLKLIWRNKRPKTTIYVSLGFVLYGLIFYTTDTYQQMPAFLVFIGIFITGVFMINFGQFIPAWDASYYPMIMAQNIPIKQYLASKAGLITFSVIVLATLSTPYLYFGWEILLLNMVCALYNIGVNVPLMLYAGSFNTKRIDLDKSPFMNYQGMGVSQWLVSLPLIGVPVLIFYIVYKFLSYESATIALAILGIAGIFLRGKLMDFIAVNYKRRKYRMINGFKQKGE